MTSMRLSTFFEAYDSQDASLMAQWAEKCLAVNPQMVVEVFCACVQDPDESVAVDFMLKQLNTEQQWVLALHLFKEHKSSYFAFLYPKIEGEHSFSSFQIADYILLESIHTQNTALLNLILPSVLSAQHSQWVEACADTEVIGALQTAMDLAVEMGCFEQVQSLLPHVNENVRHIPALTAVEWQRADHLDYILKHSSFQFCVEMALHTIQMPKSRKMARYILNTHPAIVCSDVFVSAVHQWKEGADKEWTHKYIAQKQRSKISSAVQPVSSSAMSASSTLRKM